MSSARRRLITKIVRRREPTCGAARPGGMRAECWRRGLGSALLVLAVAAWGVLSQADSPPASAECQVLLTYGVNLGQGNTSQVPIFVASITLQNNGEVRQDGNCCAARGRCMLGPGHEVESGAVPAHQCC